MFLDDASYKFIADPRVSPDLSHSFLNEKWNDLGLWKETARLHIRENLHYAPTRAALNERIAERVEFEHYIREKVIFDSAPGCSVPAYLLIPKQLRKPAPAIIALHDHGAMFYWGKDKAVEHPQPHPVLRSHFDTYYGGVPLASGLANRGYVVLVIDSLFFGERRWKPERNPGPYQDRLAAHAFETEGYIWEYNAIEQEIESNLVRSIFYKGHTFQGIQVWDDIVSVDYLCSRPEVDPQRIGCIGLSMGGRRSGWLAAMDDRIRCSVVVGWMARHEEMIRLRIDNIAWMWAAPGVYQAMDYPDIVSLAAPKPMLVQHGTQDDLYPEQTGEKAIEIIRQVYRKAGCEPHFQAEIYDVPHVYDLTMQINANRWLDRHLM